jgi:PAS domain S-box-containing protein
MVTDIASSGYSTIFPVAVALTAIASHIKQHTTRRQYPVELIPQPPCPAARSVTPYHAGNRVRLWPGLQRFRFYRDFFENANDVFYIADQDGAFELVNPAGKRLTGFDPDLEAVNLFELVAPEHLPLVYKMAARKANGTTRTTYELEIITKDGHRDHCGPDDCRLEGHPTAARLQQTVPAHTPTDRSRSYSTDGRQSGDQRP